MSDFDYTPDQKAAISSNSNMVITACPGSGKTTVIAEKIRNEVKSLHSYQGVIGITFTVKASKELKKRCKQNACDTKMSFFGTIDNFCLSEIINPFFSRVINKKKYPFECVKFDEVPEFIIEKLSAIPNYSGEINSGSFRYFEEDIKILFEHGLMLLEFLGVIANHVITESHACQRYILARYKSVYIDEYQDSSEPQHALFLKLLKLGLTGVAVGDIQQSIYAWRGSDPKFIKELIDNSDIFEHHVIDINHRCHPSITNYANRLYDATCDLLPTNEIRVFRCHYSGTQIDVAKEINKSIESAIKNKVVESYSQIGILVRNNQSLEFLNNELKVPFRIFDEDPLAVRNTKVCNLFSQLLRFRFDQNHHLNDVIEYIQSFTHISNNNLSVLRREISTIRDKIQDELSNTIIDVTGEILNIDISASDKELINTICLDSKLLRHYKPINENEVQVMTLHKSKGLEFELVYHLDLYDWIHPKRKFVQGNYDVIYDNWEQELNLHFVGITRAKKFCVLVTSNNRINRDYQVKVGNPSQFFALPGLDDLYKNYNKNAIPK